MDQMEFVVRQSRQNVPIIDLRGEIDIHTAPVFKNVLSHLIDQDHTRLLINLTQVDYLDSSGLGVIAGGLKRVRERNGGIALVNPRPHVRRVFEITRLDRIIPICATEEQALEVILEMAE